MSILLLGGTGYLGTALFDALTEAGHAVQTIDLCLHGPPTNPDNLSFDYRSLSTEALEAYEVIIHLAGHSSVPMCRQAPRESFHNNVGGFVDLLERLPWQKLIYASSVSVYGNTRGEAVTEDACLGSPLNAYDLHKREMDYHAALSPVRYYGLRFGSLAGAARHMRVDVMLNRMFDTARRQGCVRISNREIHRPILGIQDCCRAIRAILEQEQPSGVYNLASCNATVHQLGVAVADRLRVPLVFELPSATYDICVSTERFRRTFAFDFCETPDSMVDQLSEKYASCHRTSRD